MSRKLWANASPGGVWHYGNRIAHTFEAECGATFVPNGMHAGMTPEHEWAAPGGLCGKCKAAGVPVAVRRIGGV